METLDKLVQSIAALTRRQRTLLIGIDGRGGSGKTTLAETLQQRLPVVSVVHLDDFAYPMDGADRQRLLDQVILPLKSTLQHVALPSMRHSRLRGAGYPTSVWA